MKAFEGMGAERTKKKNNKEETRGKKRKERNERMVTKIEEWSGMCFMLELFQE